MGVGIATLVPGSYFDGGTDFKLFLTKWLVMRANSKKRIIRMTIEIKAALMRKMPTIVSNGQTLPEGNHGPS